MQQDNVGDGMEHVRMLADEIGSRPTGSDGEARAAAYLCEQLTAWGLAGVGTEPFAARGWDFDVCRLTVEGTNDVDALPVEYSGSTPADGLTADLRIFEAPADLAGADLGGCIALVCGGLPEADVVQQTGVEGLILTDFTRRRAWHHIYGPLQPLSGRLPMVAVGFDDAVDLVRHGVRRVTLQVHTTIQDVTGHNVVGTLEGSASSDRRFNVSGHYDSVVCGPAAADNATGTACAMEVVHALSRQPLSAPVDLVIFSAEEIGLYGAAAYAEAHAEALESTRLGIYYDGQGDFLGRNNVHVIGQPGLSDWVQSETADIGYATDVHYHFTGLDQAFLSAHGVPTLWFQRSPQHTWHTRADVTADVSPEAMRESIAAAVHLLRRADADPGLIPAGIEAGQAQQIRDYVAGGAPVW